MQNNINHQLYRSTRKKYLKFLSRYKKAVSEKGAGNIAIRHKNKLANTLKRLYKQLKSLELKIKLGFAAGSIAFALQFNSANAQELGPFVQNVDNNPFKSSISLDNNKQPFAVDLDNDGDFDIVVGIQSGEIEFLENTGTTNNPNFIQRTGVANPFDGIYNGKYSSPSFGDLDGDGDQDMIFGTYYNRPRLFENYGNASSPSFNTSYNSPSLIDEVYTSFPATGNFYSRPELVDIDNDGDLDIFIGRDFYTNDYNAIAFWQNDGSNNFTEQIAGANPLFLPLYNANANIATRFDSTYPSFVDIDNDGDLDLFVGDENGNLRFFQNTGNATSPSFSNEITGVANPLDGVDVGNDASPEFVDLDNDGDFDLIVGSSLYGALDFFENIGSASSPTFVEITDNNSPFVGFLSSYDVAPTTVDVDGDNFLDVVLGVKYDSELRYFRNNQNGQFLEQTGASNPFNSLTGNIGNVPVPAFSDIDNDGDDDLFVTTETTSGPSTAEVLFFRNNGTFDAESSPVSTNQNYTQFSSSLADFDGDLDFDVLIGGYNVAYSGSNLLFLENTGTVSSPTFDPIASSLPPVNNLDVGDNYLKPFFVDLDHDGDPDVVSGADADYLSGQLLFFENDGTNLNQITGAASPFFDNGSGTNFDFGSHSQPALLDVDNDGDLDVLVGLSTNEIIFLENQNIPPQVNANTTTVTFTEGDAPLALDPTFTISDATNDLIIGARITIQNYVSGEDILSFTPGFGVSGVFETSGPEAGTLILNNNGIPPSQFSNVLQTVTYENSSISPNTTPRNIQIAAIDFDNTDPLSDAVAEPVVVVNVISVNDAPVVATTTADLNYTEGDGLLAIDNGISVSDADNSTLVSATISITSNHSSSEDLLEFTTQNGITGNYDSSTGILTLSGTSSVANYQTALRSVFYNNVSNNPSNLTRTIEIEVNDGTDPSNVGTRNIIVIPVNDAPSISNSTGDVTFTEGDPSLTIDSGITVSDLDNTSLTGATVSISSNFATSEDVLEFTSQNGITGNYDSSTGILTLSGTSSVANYQTALRSVLYNNVSSDPSNQTRTISFEVNDGTDPSNVGTRNVIVIPANDAPTVSNSTGDVTFTEGDPLLTIDSGITVSDSDDTSLTGATVSISSNLTPSEDFLEFATQNGITGNYDSSTGILMLSGTSSVANYQTALRSVLYNNVSNNPSNLTRTIAFEVNDGTDPSNVGTRNVIVIPVNDPPVIVSDNGQIPLAFTQNTTAIAIDPLIEVSDVDNTTIAGATVVITNFQTGDQLSFNNQNGITGSVNSGTLTLSGTATTAQYQTALRTVTFQTSNGTGSRAVNFTVNDGTDSSSPYPRTINITGSGTQPPVVNTTPASTQVGSVVTIDLCQIISDPDNSFDELTIEVISTLSGAATTKEDCNLRIDYAGLNFSGEDNIVVRATDPDGNTDENTLVITVESFEPGGDLIIYNAVSPNNDGLNDWWEIVNLTSPNQIQLFNRWGDLVKTITDYENIENNTQLNDLPAGTYFYKIESPQGSYEGFLVIKK